MTQTPAAIVPLEAACGGQARRHWLTLLLATLLVQGVMVLSYPLGTVDFDDNQAAQAYMMGELVEGNLLIGNVRYNTGYAFVMAPFRALANSAGRLSDRLFLLMQVSLSSTIPFMVYDILRRRFNARIAIISALVVLIDPFALQWAHFRLPGWLIATAFVFALWLTQLAWSAAPRRRMALIALASAALGVMCIARLNFAPLVAIFGVSFLGWRHITVWQRAVQFLIVGLVSGGILIGYVAFVHVPSVGTTTLSCVGGTTLFAGLLDKEVPIRPSNGPRTAEYAGLLTLKSWRRIDFYSDTYPLWRQPGPWASDKERTSFLSQPVGVPPDDIEIGFQPALYWNLGPCATDALLYDVGIEAIANDAWNTLVKVIHGAINMLVQNSDATVFHHMYLDHAHDMTWSEDGTLGFYAVNSRHYNGHRLWRPGVQAYSSLFEPLNLLKLLTPIAILAALWKRDWFLTHAACVLLFGLLLTAAVGGKEPRYYAMLAPFFTILIGWFIAQIVERFWPSSRGST